MVVVATGSIDTKAAKPRSLISWKAACKHLSVKDDLSDLEGGLAALRVRSCQTSQRLSLSAFRVIGGFMMRL